MNIRKTLAQTAILVVLSGIIVLIFVLSSQPYRVQNIQPYLHKLLSPDAAQRIMPDLAFRYDGKVYRSDVNPFGLIEFLFRKCAHLFVYGILAIIAALALKLFRQRGVALVWLPMLVVLVIAVFDELNQQYAPARTPAVQDVLVDLAGGGLGLAVGFGTERLYRRLRRTSS